MPMNLHALANRVVRAALPNVDMVAIRCNGFTQNYGQHTMTYGNCERVNAQKQTLNGDELQLVNEVFQAELSRKFYLSTQGAPLTAGRRYDNRGADYLYELDTQIFWRIYNINEDYSDAGWQLVFAAVDSSPPEEVINAFRDSGIGGPMEFYRPC